MDEQMRKERAEATLRARAAAWEAEKAEAQANRVTFAYTCWAPHLLEVCDVLVTVKHCEAIHRKQLQRALALWPAVSQTIVRHQLDVTAMQERFERQRWRTKNARAARHARILQKFWHTNSGLVWQDGLVAAMLLASLGLGAFQLRGASTATNSKPDPEDCL